MTLEEGKSEVVVADSTTASTITIPADVTDASINVANLAVVDGANKVATLPAITINTTVSINSVPVAVVVAIPTGTVVTAASAWDGKILAPAIQANSSVTLPTTSGYTKAVQSVILVGDSAVSLTFDKAVKVTVP